MLNDGIVIEAQFSNYPFLLNNTAELLYKSKVLMADAPIEALIIITKAHMFPASQSTLYYEQAANQISELARNNVIELPIRLVGLFADIGTQQAIFTNYHAPRYSRTVVERSERQVRIAAGRNPTSRCRITFA
jgi:hypothetical protein